MDRLALRFCARSPVICSIAFSKKKSMRYLLMFSVLICLSAPEYGSRSSLLMISFGSPNCSKMRLESNRPVLPFSRSPVAVAKSMEIFIKDMEVCCKLRVSLIRLWLQIYSFSLDFQNIEKPFLFFEPYFLIFNTFSFSFSHSRALLLRIRREAKKLSIHSVMPTNQ